MRSKYLLKTVVAVCAFFAIMSLGKTAFCDDPTADELIEQGKQLLLEEQDIYGADAKFAEALAMDPPYPTDEKAYFWRAITVISSNPDLKQFLKDMEILSNDGNDDFIIFDQEDNLSWTYTTVNDIIIDNQDAGYSEIGTDWETPNPLLDNSYGDDCRVNTTGDGSNKAIWTPTINTAGDYHVSKWWAQSVNNAIDAEYTIFYDGGSQIRPSNQQLNYGNWVGCGDFKFTPGQPARVELSNNTSTGQAVADAVRFVYESLRIDAETPDATFTGPWADVVDVRAMGGQYKEIASGSGGTCVWAPNIPTAGKYQVCGRWFASGGNATDATYEIRINTVLVDTIQVNQQWDDNNYVDLGLYDFEAGTVNTITLLQNAGGKVTIDSLRLIPVRSAPTLTGMQSMLSSMIDEIDLALDYLDEIVTSTFQDTVDMDGDIIEIDYGDVWMMRAALFMLQTNLNIFDAYDMDDMNIHKLAVTYYDLISINYILNLYTNLAGLRPDAADSLSDAKQALIDGLNAYFDGYDFILSEIDDQDDDFITFNSPDSQEAASIINPKLQELLDNLEGTEPVFTITNDDFGDDFNGDTYLKMVIDFTEFFDNPKDIRALLPQFDEDGTPLRSTAPDPTLGGVLPEMTEAILNGHIFGLGSQLYYAYITWDSPNASVELGWEEDPYADFVSYSIYRSTTDTVNENSDQVYASTDKVVTTFTDDTIDENQRYYYYRLYTYYSNGDKSASEIKRIITKVYVDINTSGTEEGTQENPYKLLRDGVAGVARGTKVCVAAGTYSEADNTIRVWDADRLYLEGGYEPVGWSRDIEVNETIIDATGHNTWNCVGFSNGEGSVIDGFTITGANSREYMAGISLWNASSVVIRNCKINNCNRAINVGENSSCIIENCVMQGGNQGGAGMEGISIWQADSVEIRNSSITEYGLYGIYANCNSLLVRDSYIARNGTYGIQLYASSNLIFNNIIENNGAEGTHSFSNDNVSIISNTILENGGAGGIYFGDINSITIQNNILAGNDSGWGKRGIYQSSPCITRLITNNNSYGHTTANYGNCGTDTGQDGNISADPLFVTGPEGDYYLSQIEAGQGSDSPCIDSGSDTAENLGLSNMTTRTDEVPDSGVADMGYHYACGASGAEELIVDFGASGIWARYDDGSWTQLQGLNPELMITGELNGNNKDELIVDFGPTYGIWARYDNGTWTNIHGLSPESMITARLNAGNKDELIIDFGSSYGIWVRFDDGTWAQLHGLNPELMVTGELDGNNKDEIIIDFGPSYGIWIRYDNGTWAQLHGLSAALMATGDLDGNNKDEIIIDFGQPNNSIWVRYDDGSWSNTCTISPNLMAIGNPNGNNKDEVIIDLGSPHGIWVSYDNYAVTTNVHSLSPGIMITGKLDVGNKDEIIVDFGPSAGIWSMYNDVTWTSIHGSASESMVTGKLD